MWQPQNFYSQYVLRAPVILSGNEAVRGLYNYPSARIAVIHRNSFRDEKLFADTFAKKYIRFIKASWENEPDIDGLKGTIAELEAFSPDTIIAVGGGSVIDGSKLCRLFYEFPEVSRPEGGEMRTKFIAVPTTIGSGAEVSSAAVFVEHHEHRKNMFVLHELLPEVVVYDSRYVSGTPARLLCASGLDALSHVAEGYVSTIDNAFIDVIAEKALSILRCELGKLTNNQYDPVNFQRLQYAGYIGGVVQNHCVVGAAHAVAHQLTDSGYSHGEAVGLVLPAVIEANSQDNAAREKYNHLAVSAGFAGVDEMTNFIRNILRYSGIEEKRNELSALLQEKQNDPAFIENVKNDRAGRGNPTEITDSYIEQVIELC